MINREKYTKLAQGAEILVRVHLDPNVEITTLELEDFEKIAALADADVDIEGSRLYFEIEDPGNIDKIHTLLKEFGW